MAELQTVYIKVEGDKRVRRATKAIKDMAKALEKLDYAAIHAGAALARLKSVCPAEIQVNVGDGNDEQAE